MRNKCEANHVLYRDVIYYCVRPLPHDLTSHYDVKRLCFSLKTKSASIAIHASKSINERREDYWLGFRLQNNEGGTGNCPVYQLPKRLSLLIFYFAQILFCLFE